MKINVDYLICTTHRTRSTLLCQLLTSTGVAGYPKEYRDHTNPENVESFLEHLENTRHTRHSDINCAKIMYRYHRLIRYIDTQKTKFLWMRRQNKVKQSISYLRARKTGKYNSETGPAPIRNINVSNHEIEMRALDLMKDDLRWDIFFKDNGIQPLVVWYEELENSECHKRMIQKILIYLNISKTPRDVSFRLTRQSDDWNEKMYRNYINE